MRWKATIERIREIIKSGKLGEIESFTAYNYSHNPMWWQHWMDIPERSYGKRIPIKPGSEIFRGGCLTDHPHIFDLIRHLTGSSFDYIYAEVAPNLRDGLKVEDMLMAVGKMKDGTAFLFDPSWSRLEEKLKVPGPGWERFPKRMEVNLTVTGEKGMLTCDCFGPNVYHNGAPNDRYTVQYTYFDEWVGLIDEFVDCIRNGKTPLINLKWHKETIQAMLGCYTSIQTGQIASIA
jgi:predicted dehydrogenase